MSGKVPAFFADGDVEGMEKPLKDPKRRRTLFNGEHLFNAANNTRIVRERVEDAYRQLWDLVATEELVTPIEIKGDVTYDWHERRGTRTDPTRVVPVSAHIISGGQKNIIKDLSMIPVMPDSQGGRLRCQLFVRVIEDKIVEARMYCSALRLQNGLVDTNFVDKGTLLHFAVESEQTFTSKVQHNGFKSIRESWLTKRPGETKWLKYRNLEVAGEEGAANHDMSATLRMGGAAVGSAAMGVEYDGLDTQGIMDFLPDVGNLEE